MACSNIPLRVVLVTGGSNGIGRAIVESLVGNGNPHDILVVANGRNRDDLESLKTVNTSSIEIVVGDITHSIDRIQQVVTDICEKACCPLTAIVHNAGVIEPLRHILPPNSIEGLNSGDSSYMRDLRQAFDVNFFSAVELSQRLGPLLKKSSPRALEYDGTGASTSLSFRSTMLFMSSGAATDKFITKGWTAYCATKGALLQFAHVLAKEETEFTVVSLGPGIVNTGMQDAIQDVKNATDQDPGCLAFLKDLRDKGMMRSPAEVGRIVERILLQNHDFHDKVHGKYFELNEIEKILEAPERSESNSAM